MSKQTNKRFRRTPEEIEAGLTVDEAKKARKQKELQDKHEQNPTVEVEVGLGDVVEKVTKATGIKKMVELFTPEGKDCGCDERQEKLNKYPVLKNKVKVECLTVDEYNFMKPLLSNNRQIRNADAKKLREIYERVFNVKLVSSCVGCSFARKLDELKAVLKAYE